MVSIDIIDFSLAQRAAEIIIGNYALPHNLKHWGYCVRDSESKRRKRWVTVNRGYVSNKALTENIHKRTNKVYGVAHKTFTHCLILDADDPTRQDAWVLMEFLEFKGIKYKAFDSGKGVHIWTFWENLPPDLMHSYGGPHKVFEALGKWILEMLDDDVSADKIDLRGCNNSIIKLPGQWEPVYEKYMLPYDHNRELITNYYEVVDFMMKVEFNNPERLKELLFERTVSKTFDSTFKNLQSGDGTNDPGGFLNREKYLTQVTVGPGESNDFIHLLVRKCCGARMSEAEILDFVKQVYQQGKEDGRVTCKDRESDWLSKARGRIKFNKKLPQLDTQVDAKFYQSDFDWLDQHIQEPNDDKFLACHLWAFRKSSDGPYYISYETVRGLCRMGHKAVSGRIERFTGDGVIRMVEKGKVGPPRPGKSRATAYELLNPPTCNDGLLDEQDVMGFIRAYHDHRRTSQQHFPISEKRREKEKKQATEKNTLNVSPPTNSRQLPPELLTIPNAFDDPALLENLKQVTMKILRQHSRDSKPAHPRHPAPDKVETNKGSRSKGASKKEKVRKLT